jgi:hypothetical protein
MCSYFGDTTLETKPLSPCPLPAALRREREKTSKSFGSQLKSMARHPNPAAIELSNRIQEFFLYLALAHDRNLLMSTINSRSRIKN